MINQNLSLNFETIFSRFSKEFIDNSNNCVQTSEKTFMPRTKIGRGSLLEV